MALSTEMILTLQQLNGIGNKTIFKIADTVKTSIQGIEQLCQFWKTLKGKKLESIDTEDLDNFCSCRKKSPGSRIIVGEKSFVAYKSFLNGLCSRRKERCNK